MRNYLFVALSLVSVLGWGQKKKMKEDQAAIMQMCGCYKVQFNFAETFSPDTAYTYHENYRAGALEWVFPVTEEAGFVQLQHLLIVSDEMIVKHWRQDWKYENTDLFVYDVDNTWKYKKLDENKADGQWTQKVYQVDDSPRYEGSASWVHTDGKHYWEAEADAPLPRREHTKRDDYNVMARTNRQEITSYGWLHEQDNQKVVRSDTGDNVLVGEKGYNTYTKVDDSQCTAATKWWATNKRYWADVRTVWDEVFAAKKDVSINMRVDRRLLYKRLFSLGADLSGENYDQEKALKGVREIIQSHLASDIKVAAN